MKEKQKNRWLLGLTLFLFALAFYYQTQKVPTGVNTENQARKPPSEDNLNSAKSIDQIPRKQDIQPIVAQKNTPKPQISKANLKKFSPIEKDTTAKGAAYRIPPGKVGFKVVKGKAIAFGDIVIGQVQPEFEGKIGAAKIPRPQVWYLPIPFAIDPRLPNLQKIDIQDSLLYLVDVVGLEFVEYDGSHEDVLYFTESDEHCYSYLGMIGGTQPIYLSPGCGPQAILHELLHSFGFVHEQNRRDRDSFLQIFWQNIQPDYHLQFMKVPEDLMEVYGNSSFDYESIMLYQDTFFAKKRGKKTMTSKTRRQIRPIQNGLSTRDIERLQKLYGL
jgi:hypothetical protein